MAAGEFVDTEFEVLQFGGEGKPSESKKFPSLDVMDANEQMGRQVMCLSRLTNKRYDFFDPLF